MTERHSTPISDPQTVLRSRARALARPRLETSAAPASIEVLEFRLGRERYAVESRYVCEVQPLKQLTPLPSTPAVVLGVINVRGRAVPVYDLKRIFDLPQEGLTDHHQVVIVQGHGLELGLLTDTATRMALIALDALQASLPTLTGIRADYLKGVTAERVVVLDLGRLLTDPNIIVHEEVDS